MLPGKATNYNLSKEKYLTMRCLQNGKSFIIKQADKGSAVIVWDRTDFLKKEERQLSHEKYTKKLESEKKIKLSWWKKVTNCFLT